MIRINTLTLRYSFVLAPMAGISDLPFRTLNRSFGCELAFVEMINARSISYKSKKTKFMLTSNEQDRPLGVQLVGVEPEYLKRAVDVLRPYTFDVLDFNAACPVPKVARRGEGAALMQDPKKLASLLSLVVRECDVPVTVKIRTGWDVDSINAPEVARAAEDVGAAAIFIHGRTRQQHHSRDVDYETIARVKRAVSIPVFGSGNIFSHALAEKMRNETGCDGVLVARGALGNPWIFQQLQGEMQPSDRAPLVDSAHMIETMLTHLHMCVDYYGERKGIELFRKFFCWYTKGFPHVRTLRQRSSKARTLTAMEELARTIPSMSAMEQRPESFAQLKQRF